MPSKFSVRAIWVSLVFRSMAEVRMAILLYSVSSSAVTASTRASICSMEPTVMRT